MPKRHGKATFWIVAILAVIALAVTNPSEQAHRVKIAEAVRNAVASEGFWGTVIVAMGATDSAVQIMPVEYHNYVVFSTVTCDGKRLSIGVLGNVVLTQ